MTIRSLGKITVPVAGTPVPISPTSFCVWKVRISQIVGAKGRVYVGDNPGFNHNTGAGLLKDLSVPVFSVNSVIEAIEYDSDIHDNSIDLRLLYLDAATSGDGAIVTYIMK